MLLQSSTLVNLLPYPRSLKRQAGIFVLPKAQPLLGIAWVRSAKAPNHPEGYSLTIDRRGVRIKYREVGGLRAAGTTLRQLLREYGRRLPCLKIRDWPDFARRGVMLDISRGRVPKLETLLDLVERLADFKINEFQLYTEHTFAYRRYKSAWQSWGALTAAEIRTLDARCRELGIDLVPNQNSFGHLRYFLEHPKVKKLAEVSEPYEGSTGDFLRFPTTLAPSNPGTIKFIRELYDELLPNFSSKFLNVGCDETWDLGRGQSKKLCERRGKGRVYVDFLKQIHRLGHELDHRPLVLLDGVEERPHLARTRRLEHLEEALGRPVEHPQLDANRSVDSPEGDDEGAGGGERRRPHGQADVGERRQRVEHPLPAHGREEGRERRSIMRSVEGRHAREAVEPSGRLVLGAGEVGGGRRHQPGVEAAGRVPDEVDAAAVVGRRLGDQARELRRPPPDGRGRGDLHHVALQRVPGVPEVPIELTLDVAEVVVGPQTAEAEHARREVDSVEHTRGVAWARPRRSA